MCSPMCPPTRPSLSHVCTAGQGFAPQSNTSNSAGKYLRSRLKTIARGRIEVHHIIITLVVGSATAPNSLAVRWHVGGIKRHEPGCLCSLWCYFFLNSSYMNCLVLWDNVCRMTPHDFPLRVRHGTWKPPTLTQPGFLVYSLMQQPAVPLTHAWNRLFDLSTALYTSFTSAELNCTVPNLKSAQRAYGEL